MKIRLLLATLVLVNAIEAQINPNPVNNTPRTQKPVIMGKNWVAITGKPLAATAGSTIFQKGGNAVDAACAMIAATCTMFDVLSWGGETQALIFNPKTKEVVGINALGIAPTGATADFFKDKGMKYPPATGPLAAVTPGTPGGIMTMLANYGTLSLKDILSPAIQLAEGFPVDYDLYRSMESNKEEMMGWLYTKKVFFSDGNSLKPGDLFKQADLVVTLKKLVEAEQTALKKGKSRKEAIMAAYERFYKGDIANDFVKGTQEQGGLITKPDLAKWKVIIETPLKTNYKGIEVYKLREWQQGPVLLQNLNMLENFDLQKMKYNSAQYIHILYQVMNLGYADRDFYYGDPYNGPIEPIRGLLSKEYAKSRIKQIDTAANDANTLPGDPYPFENKVNPYLHLLDQMKKANSSVPPYDEEFIKNFYAGTTSVTAADKEGWVVSVVPSGGWVPVCIAGNTGIGLSQRMQSFVLDSAECPFNVVTPGARPRVTLTPTIALKNGAPYLAFGVQGGDSQDQNLLQFFLNVVEFGMNVQEACEASNINSYQMKSAFGDHEKIPGKIMINASTPQTVRDELIRKGYTLEILHRTSGPITAIYFDQITKTIWGGASNHGDDYGIGW
ncbi:MAG: gamma-glutamyltransferase [Saprospiraceae bacterium]